MSEYKNKFVYNFRKKSLVMAVASVAAMGVVQESMAQLEEIVVTATRREQSMVDIPYNISALTGDQLRSMDVVDFSKLTRVVPGLQLTDRGVRDNTTTARVVMRGLNTESTSLADSPFLTVSPVATYVDDTPVFTNLRMYDVERVEVLRGPQGTLYGSGSLGGTIRFIHKQPHTEGVEGALDASIGMTEDADDENYSVKGMINIPLGSAVAARFSAGYDSYAGFIDAKRLAVLDENGNAVLADPSDPFTSPPVYTSRDDVNEGDVSFIRGSVRVNFSDSLSAQFNIHHQEEDSDHRDAQSASGVVGDRETAVSLLEPGERELDLYSLEIEADFGFATLTSSTSYTESESQALTDGTGLYNSIGYLLAPSITAPVDFNSGKDIFVQEFRLVSAGESRVDWIAGAFYMDEDSLDLDEFDYFRGENAIFGPYFTDPNDLFLHLNRESEFTDMAIYGEISYHVTEKFSLTGGMRAFDQEFKSTGFFDFKAFGYYPADETDFDESDVLFKVNASYDINDDTMVYATFSQGFRRGGANSFPTEGPLAESGELSEYDSDRVDNYELGLKGTLGGMHQYSTAIYYIDWADAQIGILTPNVGYDAAVNAGDAESYGFEGEIFGDLTDRLSYNLGYSYTNAELVDSIDIGGVSASKGTRLPGVSEHTASVSLDYTQPLNNGWSMVYHADASYRSDFANSLDDSADIYREFDSFTVAAASVSLQAESWRVALYGENIFDEEGFAAQTEPGNSGVYHHVEWLTRPRTLGLRASYSF
jgi:outer membrane receptor protein involved in Fe transport